MQSQSEELNDYYSEREQDRKNKIKELGGIPRKDLLNDLKALMSDKDINIVDGLKILIKKYES